MRTKPELALQARQLEERANQLWTEHRRQEVLSPSSASAEAVTLFEFPDSTARFVKPFGPAPTEVHRFVRRIEYTPEEIGPMFTIIEEESAYDLKGELLRRYDPIQLVVTNGAMEALIAGYQRCDEDRIRERIEPIADRIEDMKYLGTVTPEAIAEVEATTEGLVFSPSARMRLRSDAIAFLAGYLEAGDFVARTADRQLCFELVAETNAHRVGERMDVA